MIKPAMNRLLSALLVALALVLGLGPAPAHTHTVLERRVPSICAERRPDAELPASPASHRPRRSLPPTTAGASTDKEGTDGRAAARSAASTWQGRQHRGAREYDPEIGRWVTKDPVLFTGGVNLYAYAENDPVNYQDVTGNNPVLAIVARSAAGAIVGGGVDLALQLATNGGNFDCLSWGSVATSAAFGALAPFSGGAAAGRGDVVYHYTSARAGAKIQVKGLFAQSSATNIGSLTSKEAVETLGVKVAPEVVVEIKNAGKFIPNKPSIVQPHPLGPGGGKDLTNPLRVTPECILCVRPVTK